MITKNIFKSINEDNSIINVHYTMGVDTYNNNGAYVLVMHTLNKSIIIMAKSMKTGPKFNEEVNNLIKYFNAKVIWG